MASTPFIRTSDDLSHFVPNPNAEVCFTVQDPNTQKREHKLTEEQQLLLDATGDRFGVCNECHEIKDAKELDFYWAEASEDGAVLSLVCLTCKSTISSERLER